MCGRRPAVRWDTPNEADNLKHFAYNVVALTPRCAEEMGYEIPPEDAPEADQRHISK